MFTELPDMGAITSLHRTRLSALMRKAPVRRAAIALAIFLTVAWLVLYALLVTFMMKNLHMNDFGKFYYSARLFLDGHDMYGPSPATTIPVSATESQQFLNMNPPHFQLLMLPLALLPPESALGVWFAVNLIALVVTARVISSELCIHWTPGRLFWTIVASVLCSATAAIVVTGQLTFVLLLPVTLAWVAARHNAWKKAAVFIGILASVKPFLGIFFVYFVFSRRWRPAAIMIFSGLVCALFGLAVFGWTAYSSWVASLSSVNWTWPPMNGSIAALIDRALLVGPLYTAILDAPAMAGILKMLISAALAVFSLTVFLRDRSESAVDRTFVGLLLTALLVSPLGWVYYLWLPIGPAAALWSASRSRVNPLRDTLAVAAIPGLLTPFLIVGLSSTSPFATLTFGSLYSWTMLALWGSVIADWASTRTAKEQLGSRCDRSLGLVS